MIKIEKLIGGTLESNGYILYENTGNSCFIIDPGYNGEKFLQKLYDLSLKLQGIILTHHHHDHVGAVNKIQSNINCPVYVHMKDAQKMNFDNMIFVNNNDTLNLETEEFRILHTPGHTMGGICIINEKNKIIFTGDTLFLDDIGRTDLADGDGWIMRDTMVDIIDKLPNDMIIYPGHGPSGSMKKVREINKEFNYALTL